jgi:hypothetical protein
MRPLGNLQAAPGSATPKPTRPPSVLLIPGCSELGILQSLPSPGPTRPSVRLGHASAWSPQLVTAVGLGHSSTAVKAAGCWSDSLSRQVYISFGAAATCDAPPPFSAPTTVRDPRSQVDPVCGCRWGDSDLPPPGLPGRGEIGNDRVGLRVVANTCSRPSFPLWCILEA